MKKISFIILVVGLALTACAPQSYFKATSTRVSLEGTAYSVPSIATLQVVPNHVSAELTASEMANIKGEDIYQTLVAKALRESKADVMIAPRFTTKKGDDGKVSSMSVVGYPAFIQSIAPATLKDSSLIANYQQVDQHMVTRYRALNSMTLADVQYDSKKELVFNSQDLFGLNEKTAKNVIYEKMQLNENADFLYAPQYDVTVSNGVLTRLTLSAFPARYVNYHPANVSVIERLYPSKNPQVFYQTVIADVEPVSERIQKSSKVPNLTDTKKVKELAREATLLKYDADLLLNEQFFFEYNGKEIVRVWVTGTPAKYTNFRVLKESDVIDFNTVPMNVNVQKNNSKMGGLGSILSIFSK